MLIDVINR